VKKIIIFLYAFRAKEKKKKKRMGRYLQKKRYQNKYFTFKQGVQDI